MWDLIVSVPDHCLSFYFDIYSLFIYKDQRGIIQTQNSKTRCKEVTCYKFKSS